jgi:hypothetical protein
MMLSSSGFFWNRFPITGRGHPSTTPRLSKARHSIQARIISGSFETDPARYGIDAKTPHNDNPSKGWAVAGIFFVKFLVAVPHLIVIAVLSGAMYIAIWIGYFVVAFTGKLPDGIQDFVAGTYQWLIRVMAWITGLSDEYPPFSLDISPQTNA